MKIGTPELKTKPATKYFDHGYIAFNTVNKELFFKVMVFDDRRNPVPVHDKSLPVSDSEHLKTLLSIKTRQQILELLA